MAAGHLVEDDGKQVTLTLRSDLRFHDGEPVRAIDAVASLKRWMQRNPYGQRLVTLTDERNPAYVPVGFGKPSLTAGPKRVHFDRIELHVIPDSATAAAALQTGEIDWVEQISPDIVQTLRSNRILRAEPIGQHDNYGALRLNHLQPPFNMARN